MQTVKEVAAATGNRPRFQPHYRTEWRLGIAVGAIFIGIIACNYIF